MRLVLWLVLLFAVAVVAALTLGANDGLVSFFWASRRVDMSLNFFVLAAVALGFIVVTVIRALDALLSLPTRAAAWRQRQHEQAAQTALRESLAEFYAARYSRAHKAAQRALEVQSGTTELAADDHFPLLERDESGCRRAAGVVVRGCLDDLSRRHPRVVGDHLRRTAR